MTLIRLMAVALALVAAVSAPAALGGSEPGGGRDAGAWDATSEVDLIGLTNRSRVAAGLRPLEADPRLRDIARWRSRDMVEQGYFSHHIPGGDTVFDELSRRAYCFRLAGENIGWNTLAPDVATAEIHAMFVASPGHRRNIVGAGWDVMGVGAYRDAAGRTMWTVLFADACATDAPGGRAAGGLLATGTEAALPR